MPLTKAQACDYLVSAIDQNPNYRGPTGAKAMAKVRAKCMAKWHKPRVKHPKCPERTVSFKRGRTDVEFTAHVCGGKKGRRRKRK